MPLNPEEFDVALDGRQSRGAADLIRKVEMDLARGLGLLVNNTKPIAPPDFGEDGNGFTMEATFPIGGDEITVTKIQGDWGEESIPAVGSDLVVTCSDGSSKTLRIKLAIAPDPDMPGGDGYPMNEDGEVVVPWGKGQRAIDEIHLYIQAIG